MGYTIDDVNRNKLEECLDNIMDNFDFKKVHDVMEHLDWKWAGVGGVPTVDDLKEEAARLLWDVCNDSENCLIATGGFEASRDFEDPEDPLVELKFVLEQYF